MGLESATGDCSTASKLFLQRGGKFREGMGNGLRQNKKGNQIMKNRNIQFKPTLGLLIPVLLCCFELSPIVQAQGPETEGAIPGFNNGEGIGVLLGRTTGVSNTGTGYQALKRLTVGN